MNKIYVIEDNLDFKTEMKKNNTSIDKNNNNICLISQQPLTRTHITLQCTHTFNYMSLYNEVCNQKMKNVYTVSALYVNQIKCPYCRTVFDVLLPYLPSECSEKKTGVNHPLKYCMKMEIECDWMNKTGKYKGSKCTKPSRYIDDINSYCKSHNTLALNEKIK